MLSCKIYIKMIDLSCIKISLKSLHTNKDCIKKNRRVFMWKVIKSEIETEEGRKISTFGIESGKTRIYDISVNRLEIEQFVRKLNRNSASEIHAYELVEDFLGSF